MAGGQSRFGRWASQSRAPQKLDPIQNNKNINRNSYEARSHCCINHLVMHVTSRDRLIELGTFQLESNSLSYDRTFSKFRKSGLPFLQTSAGSASICDARREDVSKTIHLVMHKENIKMTPRSIPEIASPTDLRRTFGCDGPCKSATTIAKPQKRAIICAFVKVNIIAATKNAINAVHPSCVDNFGADKKLEKAIFAPRTDRKSV